MQKTTLVSHCGNLIFYLPAACPPPGGAPFFDSAIPAGFPSPADDFLEQRLDLNDYLVKHRESTFFAQVCGHSMKGTGIFDGDIMVVDKAKRPVAGTIALCVLNNEYTVKRIRKTVCGIELVPENPKFTSIFITPEMDFEVWGSVTGVVRKL